MTLNHWEPWACFSAMRQSHLGVMEDNDIWGVFLMSSLLHNLVLVAVIVENPASHRCDGRNGNGVLSVVAAISGYSAITFIQNTSRVDVSSILFRPSSFVIWLAGLTWFIDKWWVYSLSVCVDSHSVATFLIQAVKQDSCPLMASLPHWRHSCRMLCKAGLVCGNHLW